MVGGVVSIITDCGKRGLEINCVGTGCERYDRLSVKIKKTDRWKEISPGDGFWWHGRRAYWSPKGGPDSDVEFEQLGYSYSPAK